MNKPSHTKQALADLSGKPVNGISMQRLAPMFAKRVVERRKAEELYEYESENSVPQPFVDHLRAKAAKLLEKDAEDTVSTLPVSSVYDALQITKQHRKASTDAGIRAWRGMLQTMWKQNRTANITAASFLKYRDFFEGNFPKSAVSEVFDEIGASGYASLPVSELLTIASRIYSQEDYDYEMMKAGLTSKQPQHVKARKFVIAVLNGEVDAPFDESASRRQAQMDLDWDFGPGDEEFYEDGEDAMDPDDAYIQDAPRGGYDITVEGKFLDHVVEWDDAVEVVKAWMDKNKFYPNIWHINDHGNADLVKDAKTQYSGSRRQADWDLSDEEKAEYNERFPEKPEPSGRVLSMEDEYAFSDEALEELSQWHASMGDPIYALSSSLYAGHDVPAEIAEDALYNLEQDWRRIKSEGKEDEYQELAGLIDELSYWIEPY